MKLSQHTLPDYFSIADRHSSWHQVPTNTFDFLNRDSRRLLVTVGDSWTWGSDISENNHDDTVRLQCLYGNVTAQTLGMDWLNLALSASSNWWLAERVEELAKIIPALEYDQIFVVCVFTGAGRWFHTQYDRYIHYPGWVANNVQQPGDFDRLILKFNQDCVLRINNALHTYNHVHTKFGTNFVDPLGFDTVPDTDRLTPWYQIMDCIDGLVSHVCMDGVKALLRMPEVLTDPEHLAWFKQWILDIIPVSEQRNQMLLDSNKFRNYHPLANGHCQWAQYLVQQLDKHL